VIGLLIPNEAGEGLSLDGPSVVAHVRAGAATIEIVRFFLAFVQDGIKCSAEKGAQRRTRERVGKAQADGDASPRRNFRRVVRRDFCPRSTRVHGSARPGNNEIVNAVLDVGRAILPAVKFFEVRFILGEENLRRAFGNEPALSVVRLEGLDERRIGHSGDAR
jgi:hypothetical protein